MPRESPTTPQPMTLISERATYPRHTYSGNGNWTRIMLGRELVAVLSHDDDGIVLGAYATSEPGQTLFRLARAVLRDAFSKNMTTAEAFEYVRSEVPNIGVFTGRLRDALP